MEKWNKKPLKDILILSYGKSLPQRGREVGMVPVYGSGGVSGYHNKSIVKGPGIIIGRKGSIGTVYFEKSDFYPIDTVFYVKLDIKNHDLVFIYYLLKSLNLSDLNSDAAVPGLNRDIAYSQIVILPEFKETQQKIASILSLYDDSIKNNNKRIKILEKMAQMLYKEWFVDFKFPNHQNTEFVDSEFGKIPEDWGVKLFSDEFIIQNGFAFKSSEYSDCGLKLTRTKDFATSKYLSGDDKIFISKNSISKYKNYLLKEFDFLLVMVGASIGKYGIVLKKDIPTLQNQNMWAIRPRAKDNLKQWIILMMPQLIEKISSFATGAARDFFRKEHFNNAKVIIPSNEIITDFSMIISNIFEEISTLLTKNQNLKKTRDLLLPRLISGELSVENLEVKYNDVT
jgi:type I restriction enzyme S subunit